MAALAIPASPLASQKAAPDQKTAAPSAERPASSHRQFPDVLEDLRKQEDQTPGNGGDGTAPSLFNTPAINMPAAAPVPLPLCVPDELTLAAAAETEPAAPAVATLIGDSALPSTTRKPAKNSLEQVLNLSSLIRRSAVDPESADPQARVPFALAGQPLVAPVPVMQNPDVEPVNLKPVTPAQTAVPAAGMLQASVGVQPPAAPVPTAQTNRPGEPAGNALDPAVRTLSANAAQTGDVALALKLVADSTLENAPERNSPQPALASPETPSRPAAEPAVLTVQSDKPAQAGNPALAGNPSGKPDGQPHQDTQREPEAAARPERQRKAEPVQANVEGPSVSGATDGAQVPHSLTTQPETVAVHSGSSSSKLPQAAQPAEPAPAPEPLKASGAARDIRFEVAGGDRRVEVRLMERGGEVQVTVRTPDSRLAGTLRENLPVLTSRLSESGFRTETGQQASQDSNPHSRQDSREQPRDAEPRRPKAEEEQLNPKNKGKDFSWFMSTHR